MHVGYTASSSIYDLVSGASVADNMGILAARF